MNSVEPTLHPPPSRRVLVTGRFDPLHDGHLFAFDVARRVARALTVAVEAGPHDRYPVALREHWVREACPEAEVVAAGVSLSKEIDVVVSADSRQARLAERMGARFVPIAAWQGIDSDAVRRDVLASWAHLPPPVRAHAARRVAVLGPESTGKTTLAQRLATHYQTVWVPEYLRAWIDYKGMPVVPSDVHAAAQGQVAVEAALARRCNRVLVCDTDLWMNVVYAEHYYGTVPPWIVAAARAQRRACTLVLAPDVPHVPDAQREGAHIRETILARLCARLERENVSFHLVQGAWDDRFDQACALIDPLLLSPA